MQSTLPSVLLRVPHVSHLIGSPLQQTHRASQLPPLMRIGKTSNDNDHLVIPLRVLLQHCTVKTHRQTTKRKRNQHKSRKCIGTKTMCFSFKKSLWNQTAAKKVDETQTWLTGRLFGTSLTVLGRAIRDSMITETTPPCRKMNINRQSMTESHHFTLHFTGSATAFLMGSTKSRSSH